MDPYRPPQATTAPAPTITGDFLFVPRDKRLPPVCLKCGSTDKERIRFESKELRQPTAGEKLGGAGGVVGAAIASQFRHDIATAIMVGAGVGAVGGGIIWLSARGSPRATVDIPLCETCLDHANNANSLRKMIVAGLLAGIVVGVFGVIAEATVLAVLGGVVFVGAIIAAFAAKLPQWQLPCQRVDDAGVTIGGVVPAALSAIAERAHPKKKKKKKLTKDIEITGEG